MLDDTRRFRCPETVAASVFDAEAVMIHLQSGRYYSAEGSAAVLWQLLESGASLGDIVTTVAEHFGLSRDRAGEDVGRFVTELVREELLVVAAEAHPSPPITVPGFSGGEYTAPLLHAYRDMADLLALDPPMPSLKPTE
jgi:hypothetical protein